MRITIGFTAALLALLALCAPTPGFAEGPAIVSAFFYPWFGSPADGGYAHWAQNGHAPPVDDIRLRDSIDLFPAYGSVVDKLAPSDGRPSVPDAAVPTPCRRQAE